MGRNRAVQSGGLSTTKYKRPEVANGGKKNRKTNRIVCGTLQSQGNCLDQCYRIRII